MTRWLRCAALAGALGLVAAGLAVHTARAQALALASGIGEAVATLALSQGLDAPRELHVNGMAVWLSVGSVPRPIAQVLRELRQGCRFEVHQHDDELGQLVCLQAGGLLRFARLQRSPGDQSFVVQVWSRGTLSLASAFPERGDAPGRDLTAVPRPAQAQRVLSAWQAGEPALLNVYRSAHDAKATSRGYRSALRAAGFQIHPRAAGTGRFERDVLFARRGSSQLAVAISQDGRGRALVFVAPL
jgi:hypothetical protein